MTAPRGDPDAPPPARPPRWQWLVSGGLVAGSIIGKVAVEYAVSELAGLATATNVITVIAMTALLTLAVMEFRGRRARERIAATSPPPSIRPQPPERTIVDLPPAPQPMIRQAEVAWLAEAIAVEGTAVLVVGRAGVGTSTCAVQAANLARQPGTPGPWYVDLNPSGRPLSTARALAAIEDKFASSGLVVLDNAVSVRQVQPLLGQPRRCRLLIAGGPAVAELKRVTQRWLPEPSGPEAARLFSTTGNRGAPATTDPATDPATASLVDLCGRQPYTVRALAYWIAARGWRPEAVLQTLRAQLTGDDWQRRRHSATVAMLLEWDLAYWELTPAARRMFRLLAMVRYPLTREAVAALAGVSDRTADRLLRQLANAGCVASDPDERYLIRPLLASYARLHLRYEEPVRGRIAAVTRLSRHLAEQAERHAAWLPGMTRPDSPWLGVEPETWFTCHQPLLDALTGRRDEDTLTLPPRLPATMRRLRFRLAVAASGWYAASGQLDDWAATCDAILAADPPVPRAMAAWAYNELGVARRRMGDAATAERELHQAVALRSRRGVAQARTNLGLALLDRGDVDGAIEQLRMAIAHRSRGDRAGRARSRLGLGVAFLATGRPRQARRQLAAAANGFRLVDDLTGYGAALSNLMLAQWALEEYLDASQARMPSLECLRAGGNQPALAAALLNAGATLVTGTVAEPATARDLLLESLELRRGLPDTAGTGRCWLYLGDAMAALGDQRQADEHWLRAERICGAVADEAGLQAVSRRLRRSDDAADHPS